MSIVFFCPQPGYRAYNDAERIYLVKTAVRIDSTPRLHLESFDFVVFVHQLFLAQFDTVVIRYKSTSWFI